MYRILIALTLLLLVGMGCNLTSQEEPATTEPVETPSPAVTPQTPFVTITTPATENAFVGTGGFIVAGQEFGSFEGNVIVHALDEAGNVLAETFTTSTGGDIGTVRNWEVFIEPNAAPNSAGSIRAFFTSARDGSTVAEDSIAVTYGTP